MPPSSSCKQSECKWTFFFLFLNKAEFLAVIVSMPSTMLHFPPLIQFHTNFLFGWDWLSHSSLCQLTRGDCFDFAADLTRLNGIGLGRVDGWLPAIISFVFLIVAYSSLPFLFSPLSFVCLTLLLSIWPTIDKTQSPTMLGALHGIGDDDGNHAL